MQKTKQINRTTQYIREAAAAAAAAMTHIPATASYGTVLQLVDDRWIGRESERERVALL
jgi:hypothetical protein